MNKSIKTILIVPPGGYYAERWKKGASMPSLGICYIAGVLEKNGFLVEIIDSYAERLNLNGLTEKIKDSAPDLIGVTFTTENRFQGFDVIRQIKKDFSNILTMAGGPHVSLAAEDTMANIPELDFIVRGEGENTVLELVNALSSNSPLEKIQGLSYRVGGKIIHNPDRPLIKDLDAMPFPSWNLVPWEKYNFTLDVPGRGRLRAANIMTSRGCPFNCNFCASQTMWGRTCRMRSADNILSEIGALRYNYNIKSLWIFDDTFTVSKKRIEEFCNKLLEREWDISWFCEIRTDTVDRPLLSLMKDAGCFSVGFGVESGSQRILDNVIGKGIRIEQVKEVAKICSELGIISNPFFIFSHPEETREDMKQTLSLINNWPKPSSISLSILHIYPGTRLFTLAKEKGILPSDFTWTKENDPRITIIPSAQGHVPIFLDKFSLSELSEYIFQWRDRQGYGILRKIPEAVSNIRSSKDFFRYLSIASGYVRHKAKKLFCNCKVN